MGRTSRADNPGSAAIIFYLESSKLHENLYFDKTSIDNHLLEIEKLNLDPLLRRLNNLMLPKDELMTRFVEDLNFLVDITDSNKSHETNSIIIKFGMLIEKIENKIEDNEININNPEEVKICFRSEYDTFITKIRNEMKTNQIISSKFLNNQKVCNLLRSNQNSQAIEVSQQVINNDNDNYLAHFNRGLAIAANNGSKDDIIKSLQRSVEIVQRVEIPSIAQRQFLSNISHDLLINQDDRANEQERSNDALRENEANLQIMNNFILNCNQLIEKIRNIDGEYTITLQNPQSIQKNNTDNYD